MITPVIGINALDNLPRLVFQSLPGEAISNVGQGNGPRARISELLGILDSFVNATVKCQSFGNIACGRQVCLVTGSLVRNCRTVAKILGLSAKTAKRPDSHFVLRMGASKVPRHFGLSAEQQDSRNICPRIHGLSAVDRGPREAQTGVQGMPRTPGLAQPVPCLCQQRPRRHRVRLILNQPFGLFGQGVRVVNDTELMQKSSTLKTCSYLLAILLIELLYAQSKQLTGGLPVAKLLIMFHKFRKCGRT